MSDANSAYPTVATIIGCPEELSSADGLVATPIGITGELQPPTIPNQQPTTPDTSDIKDPVEKAVVDNIWGKLPTKTPIEKLRCEICKVDCCGLIVFNTHLSGSKHIKRLKDAELQREVAKIPYIEFNKESNTYTCTLCNVVLNAPSQIDGHMSGTKHRNKSQSKKQLVENVAEINKDQVKPRVDATANLLFCAACNIHVNSTTQLEQHTSSKKHINKVNGNRGNKPRSAPYFLFRRGGGRAGGLRGALARGGLGRPFQNKPLAEPTYVPPPPSITRSPTRNYQKSFDDHFTSGGNYEHNETY